MLKKKTKQKKTQLSFRETLPPHDVLFTTPRREPPLMAGPFLGVLDSNAGPRLGQAALLHTPYVSLPRSLCHHHSKHCIHLLPLPTNLTECPLCVWWGSGSLVNRTNSSCPHRTCGTEPMLLRLSGGVAKLWCTQVLTHPAE